MRPRTPVAVPLVVLAAFAALGGLGALLLVAVERTRLLAWLGGLVVAAAVIGAVGALLSRATRQAALREVDVTERRRAEERTRFLATLGARLLAIGEPDRILSESTEAVASFLGVDRCTFHEVDAARGVLLAVQRAPTGPVDREVPLSSLGPGVADLLAGRTLVVHDTDQDARTPRGCPGDKAVRAFLLVPHVRDGRCTASMCVASTTPRSWEQGEIELVSAVADRVWLAFENTRLQRDLARRFEELDALYAQASIGLAFVDRERRFVRVNTALTHLDGNPPEAWPGRSVAELVPEAWTALREPLDAVLERGEVVRDLALTTTARGERRHWLVACYPVRAGGDDVHGAGLIVQDVTESTRAADRLREKRSLLDAISEAVPDLLFAKDRAHRFTLANPATVAAIGKPEARLLGHAEVEWTDDEAQARAIRENDERVMRTGRAERVEEEFGPPEDLRIYQSVKVPLRDARGEVVGLVGLGRDITTERGYSRMLERTVTERTESLSRSLASLEQLLYSIAHDLRAPNRAVHSFAELLELEYGEQLDARGRLYLERIKGAARRNDELILDLLRYGQLAHAHVPLEPVELGEVVRDALLDLEMQVAERGAVLACGDTFPRVRANRTLLKQVLANLLSNALKYVPPERVPHVTVSSALGDGAAIVRVVDNGIGVGQEHQERIFEPFERLATGSGVTGTGMGLAIVRKAVERMHGAVGVESRPGEGSTFWVRLPLAGTGD